MGRTYSQRGFTLVELLIDIAILAVLIGFIIFLIDPIKQLDKARDSRRKLDVQQVKTTLDVYYDNNNCYPTDVPFGQEWTGNGTLYIKKIPQDESCGSANGSCFVYYPTSEISCPQWNALFAKLSITPQDPAEACPLLRMPQVCVPQNFLESGYNWCTFSGTPDCEYISRQILPVVTLPPVSVPTSTPIPTLTPTPSPTPTLTLTPTPPLNATPTPTRTPTPTPPVPTSTPVNCVKNYACTGNPNLRCNLVPAGTGTYCNSNCDGNCQ